MRRIVVDSNILLRLTQPSHPHHAIAKAAMGKMLESGQVLFMFTQNMVEFWAVATRPADKNGLGLSPGQAAAELKKLRSIFPLLDGMSGVAEVWEALVADHKVSGKQAHDAHLAAAMTTYGADCLLTFNDADFKRYPGFKALHPTQVI